MRTRNGPRFSFVMLLLLQGCADAGDGAEEEVRRDSAALRVFEEANKLAPNDGAANQNFGLSVAISSTHIIVGAPGDSEAGLNSGAAYAFENDGGSWSSPKKILSGDPALGDNFGFSVDIDGDTAVMGAYLGHVGESFPGTAHVFSHSNGSWTETAFLSAGDGAGFDLFGVAVAISGSVIAVGARDSDAKSGAVYLFETDGVSWLETAKLKASDAIFAANFGSAVAIDGSLLVAGSPGKICEKGTYCGAAYLYQRVKKSWVEVAKLSADDGEPYDFFGRSVAIAGTTVAVGTYLHKNENGTRGAVYLFDYNGSSWTQTAKLTASDGNEMDSFGVSVAIEGNHVFVGAQSDQENGATSGSVYVFSNVHGTWTEKFKLAPADGKDGDTFGHAIAAQGNTIVIGAHEHDASEFQSGIVYVVDRSDEGDGGAGGAGGGGAGGERSGPCCNSSGGETIAPEVGVKADESLATTSKEPHTDGWYLAGGGCFCGVVAHSEPNSLGISMFLSLCAVYLVRASRRRQKP